MPGARSPSRRFHFPPCGTQRTFSAAPDPSALLHLLPVCCRPRASAESRRSSSHRSGQRSHGLSTGTGRGAELRAARLGAGHEAKRNPRGPPKRCGTRGSALRPPQRDETRNASGGFGAEPPPRAALATPGPGGTNRPRGFGTARGSESGTARPRDGERQSRERGPGPQPLSPRSCRGVTERGRGARRLQRVWSEGAAASRCRSSRVSFVPSSRRGLRCGRGPAPLPLFQRIVPRCPSPWRCRLSTAAGCPAERDRRANHRSGAAFCSGCSSARFMARVSPEVSASPWMLREPRFGHTCAQITALG